MTEEDDKKFSIEKAKEFLAKYGNKETIQVPTFPISLSYHYGKAKKFFPAGTTITHWGHDRKLNNFSGFTVRYPMLVKELVTECRVSPSMSLETMKQHKNVKVVHVNAVWDTGASGCMISEKVAKELHLKMEKTKCRLQQGKGKGAIPANRYLVNIWLTNNLFIPHVFVCEGDNDEMIIGMDLISKGNLYIDSKDDKTTFSFFSQSIKNVSLNIIS